MSRAMVMDKDQVMAFIYRPEARQAGKKQMEGN
jgi:hypothetical protein